MGRYIDLTSASSNYLTRTDILTRYYEDVRKYDVLTKEEEDALIKIVHDDTAEQEERDKALERLVNCNQRIVIAVARKFATDDNILDLINEGIIGLIEGIRKYDIKQPTRVMTFAIYFVYRQINNYIIQNNGVVRQKGKNKTCHIISKAANKFAQREFRQPSEEELREIIEEEYGLTITNKFDLMEFRSISIDQDTEGDDSSTDSKLINEYQCNSASFNECEKNSEKEYIEHMSKSLLGKLKPIEAKVISMLFGIGYDRSYELKEIAEECDYTTERIRQMRNEIFAKLRKEYNSIIR